MGGNHGGYLLFRLMITELFDKPQIYAVTSRPSIKFLVGRRSVEVITMPLSTALCPATCSCTQELERNLYAY